MVELVLPVYARLNLLDQFFDVLCCCTNSVSSQMRKLSKAQTETEASLIESLIIKDSYFDEKPFVFDYDADPYTLYRGKFINTMKYLLSLVSVLHVAPPHTGRRRAGPAQDQDHRPRPPIARREHRPERPAEVRAARPGREGPAAELLRLPVRLPARGLR